MYAPVLVEPPDPETPIVDLPTVKRHLRIDSDDEDALLTALTSTAVQYLDGYAGILGRALLSQTWAQDYDAFARCLRLPLLAREVAEIEITDTDGNPSALDSANYELLEDARGSYVRFVDTYGGPASLARHHGLKVTFVAGYGDAADDVPHPIRTALLLMIAHWYANREAVAPQGLAAIPLGADALIAPFRRLGV